MNSDQGTFGDFHEIKEESEDNEAQDEQRTVSRARMPYKNELVGIVKERLGGNRMHVSTTDGKTRNCRVPGKYKRKLWLRRGDVVLIMPWQDDDSKGDIIYKYPDAGIIQLRKRGILDSIKTEF